MGIKITGQKEYYIEYLIDKMIKDSSDIPIKTINLHSIFKHVFGQQFKGIDVVYHDDISKHNYYLGT